MSKRILSIVLTIAMVFSLLAVPVMAADSGSGQPVYLAFSSDVHNKTGNQSADRLDDWIDNVSKTVGGTFTEMGFCGDSADGTGAANGDSFWSLVKVVVDTVSSNSNVKKSFFIAGNHECKNGSFLTTTNDVANNIKETGYSEEYSDYLIYSFGANISGNESQQFKTADITALDNYLNAHEDFDGPIFVLSHFPIHHYNSRTTQNAAQAVAVLNDHPNVIFLWGHNHTESDKFYDQVYVAGDTVDGYDINFTYAAAGCMSDSEYSNGSNSVKGKGLVAEIDGDEVGLTYYKADGSAYKKDEAAATATTTIDLSEINKDVYTKATSFVKGKSYLIVNTNEGNGVALTNTKNSDKNKGVTFGTASVTVSGGKIVAEKGSLASAEWEARNAGEDTDHLKSRTGLYNDGTVLKIDASDRNAPYIKTGDAKYTAGNYTYTTNNHIEYPYGGNSTGTQAETAYFIGSNGNTFTVSSSESSLGKVYIYEKKESSSTGGDTPSEPGEIGETKVYTLTDHFVLGKNYIIANVNSGSGVALTNTNDKSFGTANITISDGKISGITATTEWTAVETKTGSGLIGLKNGNNVLKVDAEGTPYIKTNATSYNAGGFGYTSQKHISYPYGTNPKDYYIGSNGKTFTVGSKDDESLGKVYIFVEGEDEPGTDPVVPSKLTNGDYFIVYEDDYALTSKPGDGYQNDGNGNEKFNYTGLAGTEYTDGMAETAETVWTVTVESGKVYIMNKATGQYLNASSKPNSTGGYNRDLTLGDKNDYWTYGDDGLLKSYSASIDSNSGDKYLTHDNKVNGSNTGVNTFAVRSADYTGAIRFIPVSADEPAGNSLKLVSVSSGTAAVTITTDVSGKIYVAAYDADGRFAGVTVKGVIVEAGKVYTGTESITAPEGDHYICCFMDNDDIPVMEAVSK